MSAPKKKGALKVKRRASERRANGPAPKNDQQLALRLDRITELLENKAAPSSRPSGILYRDIVTKYERMHCPAVSFGTARCIKGDIRKHILPILGEMDATRLTASDIEILRVAALGAGLMASSATKVVRRAMAVLRFGIAQKEFEGIIVPVIKHPRAAAATTRVYSEQQLDRLVEAARRAGDMATVTVILLGADAGLRISEMRALLWTAVSEKHIHVHQAYYEDILGPPKGRKERWIPLEPHSRLKQHLEKLRRSGHYVLPGVQDTTAGSKVVNNWLGDVQRRAGFPYEASHILRHTFCSRLAAQGASPYEIMAVSGHTTLRDVMRYIHLSPASAGKQAMRRLNAQRKTTDPDGVDTPNIG